jgi:branched-chain amino acid transport system substrate-binding protein
MLKGEQKQMRTKAIAGIIMTLFLTTMFLLAVPVKSQPIDALKIGVIGPVGLPYWSPAGMKEAAEMARDEINAMGGIAFPEGNVTITLCLGNEFAVPVPDPDTAKTEIERMIVTEGCDIIIGGFRTETTTAMIEEAMDHQVPFIINGQSTTEMISQKVPVNYTRYKYLFRTNPVNSTVLWRTISGFVRTVIEDKLLPLYGQNFPGMNVTQVPVAVLTEDRPWTAEMHIALTDPDIYPYHMGSRVNVTYAGRIPETATDCTPWLSNVTSSGARIMIHAVSGRTGIPLIIQWRDMGVAAIPIGINVLAQIQDHWTNTLGKCEYETIVDCAGTGTPITPQSVDFWDNFVAKTGKWPIYTAWGAYDTIYGLKDFVETTGITWADFQNSTKFADEFEDSPERVGLSGKFKFTSTHDVYCNELNSTWTHGYVRPFVVQWQAGRKEVIWPSDQPYSEEFGIPSWMLNTPVGTNVTVTDPIADVNITFNETTSVGTTAISIGDTGPTPPLGFQLAGLYYDITTTANYAGTIEIAIDYNENLIDGTEEDLKLLKWNSTSEEWEDVTTGLDKINNIIYGQVSSLSLFAVMGPSPPSYTLTIYGSPTGVAFTADDVSHTTPWSGIYDENTSVSLVMPEIHTIGDVRYYWNQWSDGNTSRSRTVTMNVNTTLTAYYTGQYHELAVTSSPITGITFTINGVPQTTPYIEWLLEGSYTLVMAETHNGYVWSQWLEDEDTNRTKTVVMNTTTTLTAIFMSDTTPPTISIVSPENKTYPVEDVPLTFTVGESTSWIGYSLDGQANTTIGGNTSLTSLLDGVHYVVVYANDTVGNIGKSGVVYFAVDTNPPNITDVSQTPPKNNVQPEDEVKVNTTVTDDLSGVKRVTLNYAFANVSGVWIKSMEMTKIKGNVWNATIPVFPYCTNVTYIIIAEDNLGNQKTTEELGYEYKYQVIPEFQSFLILPLFMLATLLAVIVYRRKHSM